MVQAGERLEAGDGGAPCSSSGSTTKPMIGSPATATVYESAAPDHVDHRGETEQVVSARGQDDGGDDEGQGPSSL